MEDRDQQTAEEELDDLLMTTNRGDRMSKILEWYSPGQLSRDELRNLLVDWWSDVQEPSAYEAGELLELFWEAGFVTDTEGVTRPTTALTVYRGATPDGVQGMAWTLDREKAAWFARRGRLIGEAESRVYAAEIPPQGVLGIFNERGEREVVVDPFSLQDIREVPFDEEGAPLP